MIPYSEITVRGFPMPPSVNNVYANVPSGGRRKTDTYKSYEQTVSHWALQNAHQLNVLRDWVTQIPRAHAIRIDHIFHFHAFRIVTRGGKPMKNDSWNRPKVLHDCLAALLGIDDCYFWSGVLEKSPITIEGLQESVDLHFSFVDVRKAKHFSEDD